MARVKLSEYKAKKIILGELYEGMQFRSGGAKKRAEVGACERNERKGLFPQGGFAERDAGPPRTPRGQRGGAGVGGKARRRHGEGFHEGRGRPGRLGRNRCVQELVEVRLDPGLERVSIEVPDPGGARRHGRVGEQVGGMPQVLRATPHIRRP